MSYEHQTAFITGGASGIGRALARRVVEKGARVFIVDVNIQAVEKFVSELNHSRPDSALCTKGDVSSWDSIVSAFTKALNALGCIDYVFPIAGLPEQQVIPRPSEQEDVLLHGFAKPETIVLDVNIMGTVNTIVAAVQVFRSQEPKAELGSMGGKIVCVASTCGLYAIAGVPIYTASKHAIIGLIRTYGALLPSEMVTLNGICPHVVRTGISMHMPDFFDDLEHKGLLTEIDTVVDAFEEFMGLDTRSGQCLEIGPRGSRIVEFMDYMDEETKLVCDAVESESRKLWIG